MRVLIVEDDPTLLIQLDATLRAADYAVDLADNGVDALHLGSTEPYDAVVLDLGLPRLDGLSVLRRWREGARSMPVLVLTARSAWHEKVAGIDAGADDYLAKPFHIEELLARLRGLIRRSTGHTQGTVQCGDLVLEPRSQQVLLQGQPLTLTSHEWRVLSYLMHHAGAVVSRTELMEHVYAQDGDRDSNTMEVFIARLRKKLPAGTIATVRGMGYRLDAPGSP